MLVTYTIHFNHIYYYCSIIIAFLHEFVSLNIYRLTELIYVDSILPHAIASHIAPQSFMKSLHYRL